MEFGLDQIGDGWSTDRVKGVSGRVQIGYRSGLGPIFPDQTGRLQYETCGYFRSRQLLTPSNCNTKYCIVDHVIFGKLMHLN